MHFEVSEKQGVYAFGGWQYIYNACTCVNLGSGSWIMNTFCKECYHVTPYIGVQLCYYKKTRSISLSSRGGCMC